MLDKLHACVTHGYKLGKKCAWLASRYSPHHIPQFVWGADRIKNGLPPIEKEFNFDSLNLYMVDVWRASYELGVEEVRLERVLTEDVPLVINHRKAGKRRVSSVKKAEMESVEWV